MKYIALLFISAWLTACNDNSEDPAQKDWYKPQPEISFDWDLSGEATISSQYDAQIVDLDAFETDAAVVQALHLQGKKVFAYVSVGSVEDYRPDAAQFPASVVGNAYPGWDGERFLDIGNYSSFAHIMKNRFDLIKSKGFDGIEPDNIDLHTWTTGELGFDISEADVIAYCHWLVEEAHERGLSIGQKNATDLAPELVNSFDWILLEDAFFEGFQSEAAVYIQKNKAVFAVEYTDEWSVTDFQNEVCPQAIPLKYTTLLKNRDLDTFIVTCD